MNNQPEKGGAAQAQARHGDAAGSEPKPNAKGGEGKTPKAKNSNAPIAAANGPAPARPNQGPNAGKPRPNAGKPGPNAGKVAAQKGIIASKPVSSAKLKRRHWSVIMSFVSFVVMPIAMIAFYLWEYAEDQYASTVAFSVRTEESNSALELLGGLTNISGSSSSDTDILYQFLQSQKLVENIEKEIALSQIWSKPENDPIFAFDDEGTIEDLLVHWGRFINISYDDGAGLIEVEAKAFDPEDATLIAQALFDESSKMINSLSDIAREDAIRYAREELDDAVSLLQSARQSVTRFRNLHQLVDPSVDIRSQAGLLGNLEAQLAEALIELDMLPSQREDDPRVSQAQLRIEVIQRRINDERGKLGVGETGDGEVYADLYGEYEILAVEREFAEQRFLSSQVAYDSALAEARRQSRYLTAYVLPTSAESARYPNRLTMTFVYGLFIALLWATVVLVLYAIKDRR